MKPNRSQMEARSYRATSIPRHLGAQYIAETGVADVNCMITSPALSIYLCSILIKMKGQWGKMHLNLGEHLVYIDITTVCPFGCTFCMYESSRPSRLPVNLEITPQIATHLSMLVGHSATRKVVISGEGEPLMNPETILGIVDICSVSHKPVELITSALAPQVLYRLIEDIGAFLEMPDNRFNIRISIDGYHLDRRGLGRIREVVTWLSRVATRYGSLWFSFRSVFCDKLLARSSASGLILWRRWLR